MLLRSGIAVALVLAAGVAAPLPSVDPRSEDPAEVASVVHTDAIVGDDDEFAEEPVDDTAVEDPSIDWTDDTDDSDQEDVGDDDSWTSEPPTTEPPVTETPRPAEPGTVTFSSVWVDGNGMAKRVVVGNRSSIPITFYLRVQSFERVEPQPRLTLQRRIGSGAWKSLRTRVGKPSELTGAVIVRTPAYSTSAARGSVAYRLISTPFADARTGGIAGTARSSAFTVEYDNQAKYTGVARTVWQAARKYCPTTAVRIKSLPLGRAGQYQTGGLLIEVDRGVGTRWNTDYSSQVSLALHECAHERQWLNYGSTADGRTAMERAAAKHFKNDAKPASVSVPYAYSRSTMFSPIEHAADCSAQALNPGGYLGYGGYCNPRELREGRKLLLGKRY